MCPACIAAAAWIAAGAGSAGGLTAFVITRRRSRKQGKADEARQRTNAYNSPDTSRTSPPNPSA